MAIAMNSLLAERREDSTALITITPPGKPSALNHAFLHRLPATLAALDADPEVEVCVIAGGEDAFSAGGEATVVDTPSRRRQARLALAARRALEYSQTVTIAAVSGAALGGAAELMLSCNVLVASTRALFGEGVDAEQALRLGLVHRVVEPEDLIDEALAMAGRIASERTASRMAAGMSTP